MSATATSITSDLPPVRGRYTENAPLGQSGWFKCGGTAAVLFKPADRQDLQDFLTRTAPHAGADVSSPVCYAGEGAALPVHVFGALSNTIIRDGGVKGVVVRLGREFGGIETDGDRVTVGALALDANVAQVAAEAGIGGLEFFSGIPGTIGGALRMNAGCYGSETKDVLVSATAIDRHGKIHTFTPDAMHMTYRHVGVPDDVIFIEAVFKGQKDNAQNVLARMAEIKQKREASQPIREKTGGSTFANPSADDIAKAGLPEGTKVWQIVDAVGGRGLQIGGAQMSEKHCNFMINTGTATSADLEALGEEIRKRVGERFGISLRWEIKRIGEVA